MQIKQSGAFSGSRKATVKIRQLSRQTIDSIHRHLNFLFELAIKIGQLAIKALETAGNGSCLLERGALTPRTLGAAARSEKASCKRAKAEREASLPTEKSSRGGPGHYF